MNRIWIFTCAIMAFTLATRLQAANLAECAAIEDDQQRLACFDEAARAPAASQPAASGAAEAIATPTPVAAPAPAQVTAPTPVPTHSASISATPATDRSAAAAVVPTPAPAIVPTPAQAAAAAPNAVKVDPTSAEYNELFGLENQINTKGKQQIQSRIMNQFDGWDTDTVFELENGQVWKQSDNNSTFSYRGSPQPIVTIKKGYFGSFQLKVDGFNKRVRVKRVR